MDNRRKYPRLPLDAEINFQEKAFATLEDISLGGLCIISGTGQQTGKIINLTLFFSDTEEKVNIYCKIIWSRPAGEHTYKTGLEFWHLPAEAEKKIREQIKMNKLQAQAG